MDYTLQLQELALWVKGVFCVLSFLSGMFLISTIRGRWLLLPLLLVPALGFSNNPIYYNVQAGIRNVSSQPVAFMCSASSFGGAYTPPAPTKYTSQSAGSMTQPGERFSYNIGAGSSYTIWGYNPYHDPPWVPVQSGSIPSNWVGSTWSVWGSVDVALRSDGSFSWDGSGMPAKPAAQPTQVQVDGGSPITYYGQEGQDYDFEWNGSSWVQTWHLDRESTTPNLSALPSGYHWVYGTPPGGGGSAWFASPNNGVSYSGDGVTPQLSYNPTNGPSSDAAAVMIDFWGRQVKAAVDAMADGSSLSKVDSDLGKAVAYLTSLDTRLSAANSTLSGILSADQTLSAKSWVVQVSNTNIVSITATSAVNAATSNDIAGIMGKFGDRMSASVFGVSFGVSNDFDSATAFPDAPDDPTVAVPGLGAIGPGTQDVLDTVASWETQLPGAMGKAADFALTSLFGALPSIGKDTHWFDIDMDLGFGRVTKHFDITDLPGIEAFRAVQLLFLLIAFSFVTFKIVRNAFI